MTTPDDRTDELLTRAGAAWRDGQPAVRPVDPALFDERPRRRWPPVAAAAAVVATVAAGLGAAALVADDPAPTAAAPSTPTPVRPGGLLVRDGTEVTVSGQVLALPGRPVRLCAPTAVTLPAYPAPGEPLATYCVFGVSVRGLDLDAITDRKLDRGVVSGSASVEGTYAGGTVTVTRQAAPTPDPEETWVPGGPPCAPPAGGWQAGETDIGALQRYVDARPGQYVGLRIGYPDNRPGVEGTATPARTVPIVGTVLDPAVAEAALRAVHRGNLCVVRVRYPAATQQKVMDRIKADEATLREHGVYAFGPQAETGTVEVQLVVLDPAAQRWLRQVDDRSGTITVRPFVRPLG